jgi:hypothetical protein
MRHALSRLLWFTLAVVFLVEAWLWDKLEIVVARFVDLIPLNAFKQWLADTVDRLPPQAVLGIFAVPLVLLFPFKLMQVWLIMHQQWVAAILMLVFVKLVGMGTTAFVFEVTRDKLLEMAWFRRFYEKIVYWRNLARAMVEPYKVRLREAIRRLQSESSRRFWRNVARVRRDTRAVRQSPPMADRSMVDRF